MLLSGAISAFALHETVVINRWQACNLQHYLLEKTPLVRTDFTITSYLPIDYIHLQGDPVHSGSLANGNICAAAALTEGK